MRSLPLLVCLFLLLTFTSHLAFTAVVAIGEGKMRLAMDLADVPDFLEGEEVDEGTGKKEMFSELNGDDGDEEILMPARPHFIPSTRRCVYDLQTGNKRCHPHSKSIHFRHQTRVLE
ncbi:hypothetical protein TSMEX_006730 [Taenia solium]|eukprot:TsM_000095800 transcript=TsM_000095800 gene=TsM_000095800